MKFTVQALAAAILIPVSSFSFAESATSAHTFSGNVSVISSYNLRGMTNVPESSRVALQGGLDYSHESGVYAGWWGSTLDYEGLPNAFENNFYAGYNGQINEHLAYTVGTTYYYYYDVGTSDSNGFELLLGLNYDDISLTAQSLLQDTLWGNSGDTYLQATYSYSLMQDVSLNSALGMYYYADNGEFEGSVLNTTESFNFRHFNIGLSKAFGESGITGKVDYIIGGYDRADIKQKNKIVLGLTYDF